MSPFHGWVLTGVRIKMSAGGVAVREQFHIQWQCLTCAIRPHSGGGVLGPFHACPPPSGRESPHLLLALFVRDGYEVSTHPSCRLLPNRCPLLLACTQLLPPLTRCCHFHLVENASLRHSHSKPPERISHPASLMHLSAWRSESSSWLPYGTPLVPWVAEAGSWRRRNSLVVNQSTAPDNF